MSQTTAIEKKSLEAHVELCAERYNALEDRITHVNQSVANLGVMVREVHDMMQIMTTRRTDQLIGWGIGIIGALIGTVGWLLAQYVLQ